jgi:hypothetical protein
MSIAEKIFKDARAKRFAHPLARGGLFKIQEAADRLHRGSENIDQLIAYRQRRVGPKCFRACCWEDKTTWLREALLDIPFRLGYEIVPGIGALEHDGLCKSDILRLESWAKSLTPLLLDQVDTVNRQIKSSLKIEYSRWDDGESLIQTALDRTVNFADDIVEFAENRLSLRQTKSFLSGN